MGMAASQARYLALVARKSNCEYEGQQINQSRLVLSNQSANLFNQMLGLDVPVPPSTADFTKIEYSFKEGATTYTIDEWRQLASPEEDYNYIVTYHYETKTYVGMEQKMSDPQVQFSGGSVVPESVINAAIKKVTETKEAWDKGLTELNKLKTDAATLTNYKTGQETGITKSEATGDDYVITKSDASIITYHKYNPDTAPEAVKGAIDALEKNEVKASFYYNDDGIIVTEDDLKSANTTTILNTYKATDVKTKADEYNTQIATKTAEVTMLESNYNIALSEYDSLSTPTYVGNCKLELLTSLDESQQTELNQVVKDMSDEEIVTNIANCFDKEGNYLGGIYQFTLNGKQYYTTFADLEHSYASGTGINNIDGQVKLPYYHAEYTDKKIDETKKALLQTDANGRFVSVRFEDDTAVHTLTSKTVTDENAYQDAMNDYNYKTALYDKTVQDINAKTSLIQQEDQELELRLKQLDTEQQALAAEIDAVTKVIKDNIDKSFKTFGG